MKKSYLIAIGISLSTAVLVVSAWFGRNVTMAVQLPLYEALRTTAAIIFAVVGAWLAIVYPDRLRLSLGLGGNTSEAAGPRFSQLFTPIAHSAIILCLVLIVGVLVPIARQIPLLVQHVEMVRALSFTSLAGLTLWQVWMVVMTLVPADVLKRQADGDAQFQQSMDALRGLGSTEAPPSEED